MEDTKKTLNNCFGDKWKDIATTFKKLINEYKLVRNIVMYSFNIKQKFLDQMRELSICFYKLRLSLETIYEDNVLKTFFDKNGYIFYDVSFIVPYVQKYNVDVRSKKMNKLNDDDILIVETFFKNISEYLSYLEGTFLEQLSISTNKRNNLFEQIDNLEDNVHIVKRTLRVMQRV